MDIMPILATLENYALQHSVPIINVESRQLLSEAVACKQPCCVLEIGTAIGYSALLIATQLPSGSRIITMEKDGERAAVAKKYIAETSFAKMIDIRIGDAAELLTKFAEPIDMVFIDAAKGQYLNYLQQILPQLNDGAMIIADNVLFRGLVRAAGTAPHRYRTIVNRLRAYLDFVTTDSRFSTVLHDVGDGIAISCYQGEKHI